MTSLTSITPSTEQRQVDEQQETNKNTITNTINKYFKLTNKFENIKKSLLENKETDFNYFFSWFAYKFPNAIEHANFYHYTAEAWILTIFKLLEDEFQGELSQGINNFLNYTFNDILEKIKLFEIDDDLFIENLEILLGTYKITDPILKITQMKLSQLFLKKVQQAKDSLLESKIPQNLSRKNFEDILFLILKNALNLTLNELDSFEVEKNSLMLMNIYTELKAKLTEGSDDWKYKHPILNDFIKEINQIKKIANNRKDKAAEVELLNPHETFYYFAICSFSQLLQDIQIFNLNSSNIITKVQYALKYNFLKLRHYAEVCSDMALKMTNTLRRNLRIDPILPYLAWFWMLHLKNQNLVINTARKTVSELKSWVSNSYLAGLSSTVIIEGQKLGKIYIYDQIITPIKDVTIMYTTKTVNIIINTSRWSIEYIKAIYEKLHKQFVELFGEGPFIKISSDIHEKYLNIVINRKLIITDYYKVKEMINNFINALRTEIYEISSVNKAKEFLLSKYRRMLGVAEEKCEPKSEQKAKCQTIIPKSN